MAGDDYAYLSYLVRLWGEDWEGETAWRVSLDSADKRERIYFTSLDELLATVQFDQNADSLW